MYKYCTLIVLIVILIGCSQNNKHSDQTYLLTTESQGIIGKKYYNCVYSQIIDSMKTWSTNKLYAYRITNESWDIDSLLCFNKQRNKFVTALKYRITSTSTDHDGIMIFYGVKIKGKWYFFTGASIHLPREYYQKDINTPLSFSKLHEIAMEEVFNGYLKKNRYGKWEVNDNWFKNHFEGSGWGDFNRQSSNDWFLKGRRFKTKKEYYEACYLQKVKNNWHR